MFKRHEAVQPAKSNVSARKFGFTARTEKSSQPATPARRRPSGDGYRKTAALLEFGARFTGAEDTSAVMEETLRALVRDTGGDLGYIMLLPEDGNTLISELAISLGEKREFPQTRALGEGVEGVSAATAEALMLSRKQRRHAARPDIDFDGQSVLSVPLVRTHADGSIRQVCGTLTVVSYRTGSAFTARDLELAQSLAALSVITLANESRYRTLRGSFLQSLQAMARAIEAKVPFMEGHGDRVAQVCIELGKKLGLADEILDDLRAGAQLHEIGKIGVPDTILVKPGQLTTEEFAALKQYPVIGYEMCKPLGLGEQVLMLIRNHPERLDGTGYPDKLKYSELPLPLRILCVADAFDAMSSYRPYRQVMDKKARQEQLNRFAGTQFDPIVVETLKSLLAEGRLESVYQEHWAKYAAVSVSSTPAETQHMPAESPSKEEIDPGAALETVETFVIDSGSQTGEQTTETEAGARLFLTGEIAPDETIGSADETMSLVSDALYSISFGAEADSSPDYSSTPYPAVTPASADYADAEGAQERKLTLEEAAMEAAAFAAAALEAANRVDKAA